MTQYSSPISDITVNTWTPSTGATLYGCIDEPFASFDITDYISTTGTNITCEVGLSALTDPLSAANHTINVRAKRTSSGASCTAYLFEGTTQRAAFSVTVGANWATTTYTLAAGEANNITNYTNLRLRFVGTKATIACADFEVPDPPALTTSTPADSASVLTAILVTLVSLVTPIQSASVAEVVTAASAPPLQISVTETASARDVLPDLFDTASASDGATVYVEFELPPLELSVTEQVTVVDVLEQLYDSVSAVDIAQGYAELPADIAGLVDVSESITAIDVLAQLYDAAGLDDSATGAVGGEQEPPLSVGVSETVEVNEYYPGWRETAAVSEEVSGNVEIIWLVQVAEELSIVTEEVTVTVPAPVILEIAVEDASAVAEEVAGYEIFLADITDTAAVVDEAAVNVPVPVDLDVDASQTATVTEVVAAFPASLVVDVSQAVAVIDEPTGSSIQPNLTVSVVNTVSILDSAEGTFDILLSISEDVSVTDVPNASCLAQPLLIFTAEQNADVVDIVDIPNLITSLAIDVTDDAGITVETFSLDIAETIPIPPLLGTIEDSAVVAEGVMVAINPSTYSLVYLMRMS